MIKHVVMWRYRNKKDIEIAREQLESMKGKIPSVLNIEIGVNFQDGPASYDLPLITEHQTREALDAYQEDALHSRIKAILGKLSSERVVVDYEI